jgi:hypothetical protein
MYDQPQQEQQGFYTPMPDVMTKLGDSVLQLTNPQDVIYQIKLNLEGYEYNINGELLKDENNIPLINDEGKRRILGVVKSVVAQNSVMSNIESRDDANAMIQHLASKLIELLMVNMKRFEIKSHEDASQILIYALYPCWFTILRCYKQGEKTFLKGSVQEIIQGNKPQQSRGLFGRIFGG